MKKILILFIFAILFPMVASASAEVNLPVPFTSEIPDNIWTGPWKNACEEASVVMVEEYYLNRKDVKIPIIRAKQEMNQLFTWENKTFGGNADTNATETAKMINDYSSLEATVVRNPTLEQIKNELDNKHPVISLHHGQALNNPEHRWRVGGSYYHMMVLVGYDEAAKEFIVNDPAAHLKGLDFHYSYATISSTLHDLNRIDHKADGIPTVLFTAAKKLVQAKGKNAIYWIEGGEKHYVSHPRVFKNRRWSWGLIQKVDQSYLDSLPAGATISN